MPRSSIPARVVLAVAVLVAAAPALAGNPHPKPKTVEELALHMLYASRRKAPSGRFVYVPSPTRADRYEGGLLLLSERLTAAIDDDHLRLGAPSGQGAVEGTYTYDAATDRWTFYVVKPAPGYASEPPYFDAHVAGFLYRHPDVNVVIQDREQRKLFEKECKADGARRHLELVLEAERFFEQPTKSGLGSLIKTYLADGAPKKADLPEGSVISLFHAYDDVKEGRAKADDERVLRALRSTVYAATNALRDVHRPWADAPSLAKLAALHIRIETPKTRLAAADADGSGALSPGEWAAAGADAAVFDAADVGSGPRKMGARDGQVDLDELTLLVESKGYPF